MLSLLDVWRLDILNLERTYFHKIHMICKNLSLEHGALGVQNF